MRTYEAGQAVLEVSDTGPGIPAELLEQLLHEPFRQADSSTTRATGGLGLSLYIARRVLEASGGALCAQSHPQAGSTFALCLPLGQLT